MSNKTLCDYCKREIEINRENPYIHVSYMMARPSVDICQDCWLNKNNWKKIHKIEKRKER